MIHKSICFFAGILMLELLVENVTTMYTPKSLANLVIKDGECPEPTTLFGPCIFNNSVNCITDDACPREMKCCREGCNKICKPPDEPNTFIWEWFDFKADEVSKLVEASEDWVKESFDSIWELIAEV